MTFETLGLSPAIDLTAPSLLMFAWRMAGTVQQIP